jgi:hypothetical protein
MVTEVGEIPTWQAPQETEAIEFGASELIMVQGIFHFTEKNTGV